MAACHLTVEIDDQRPRSAGEPITGTIVVHVEKAITCKTLVATCIWSTHGRGNVDSGEVDSQSVYEGAWQAGQVYRYPFKLNTASWPPTYYGTYLNVSHYVRAQAKLSWAIDPKAQTEFTVTAATTPDGLTPTVRVGPPKTAVAWIIGGVLLLVVLPMFGILIVFALPFIAVIGGLYWFFRVFLPKQITGTVVCELKTPKVQGGSTVEADLHFTPQRTSTINGVEWTITCAEICTSGSGSNRKTHSHQVLKETVRACEQTQLRAGEERSFALAFPLPERVAPSLKFSDNQVVWTVVGRIDIPGWPDWTKNLPLTVASSSEVGHSNEPPKLSGVPLGSNSYSVDLPPLIGAAAMASKVQSDEAWFRQVIQQIQQSQHEPEQMAMVISAISDFEFPISAVIEEEIDTPEFEDDTAYERMHEFEWFTAHCPAQNISLALAWEIAPEQVEPGYAWNGSAAIVGYDVAAQRVLMQAM